MKKKLIKKCQYGTPRGGLVPHKSSGSWGNRGQGNELQSAAPTGKVGSKGAFNVTGFVCVFPFTS